MVKQKTFANAKRSKKRNMSTCNTCRLTLTWNVCLEKL